MINQFDSEVVSFQFGYVFALVPRTVVPDCGATIRIRNYYHRSRRLIAGKNLTRLVVVALHFCQLPQVNLYQLSNGTS